MPATWHREPRWDQLCFACHDLGTKWLQVYDFVIVCCCVMLCYVVLCYVVLCCVMLCYVVFFYVVFCNVVFFGVVVCTQRPTFKTKKLAIENCGVLKRPTF